MTNHIDPDLLDDSADGEPTFLRATPDGFEADDGRTFPELTALLVRAKRHVKLFDGGELVHTSEDCEGDPNCPQCRDDRAREYARLLLDADGRRYRLDVPPRAKRRFAAIAREGITGPIRLTCSRAGRNGRAWGDVTFSLAEREAA